MNEKELMDHALKHGHVCIGVKDGMSVFVSCELLGQVGLRECKERLGLIKRWPVKTDLNGGVVMVEGATHEDAVNRYLSGIRK